MDEPVPKENWKNFQDSSLAEVVLVSRTAPSGMYIYPILEKYAVVVGYQRSGAVALQLGALSACLAGYPFRWRNKRRSAMYPLRAFPRGTDSLFKDPITRACVLDPKDAVDLMPSLWIMEELLGCSCRCSNPRCLYETQHPPNHS